VADKAVVAAVCGRLSQRLGRWDGHVVAAGWWLGPTALCRPGVRHAAALVPRAKLPSGVAQEERREASRCEANEDKASKEHPETRADEAERCRLTLLGGTEEPVRRRGLFLRVSEHCAFHPDRVGPACFSGSGASVVVTSSVWGGAGGEGGDGSDPCQWLLSPNDLCVCWQDFALDCICRGEKGRMNAEARGLGQQTNCSL